MSDSCCREATFEGASPRYRCVLGIVITLNLGMFVTEMIAGVKGDSLALQADALDFLGDSATYAISLWVIGRSLRTRATAALIKGLSLGLLGTWVLASAIYRVFVLGDPSPIVMGLVGSMALAVNVISALLLLRYRDGDANVRSVWLCSRNDAIGNIAVLVAAVAVSTTATAWPDLVVAAIMASLFVNSAIKIVRQSLGELTIARTQRA
ncbi:MAG: cation transporter [Halofilum sp. (in: g-proteobacteria)]|nr:cation transporter [Halofilum sp. (in: g-proteobacteria)]